MAENILAKLLVLISANAADFIKGVNSSQKQLASFVGSIKKVVGAVGIAFGAQQVISFATEVTRLAGEAEGVSAAFDRLPGSTRLMQQLKEATGGTVSELELMKRSVQASNFDISLQSLPKLLEFAAIRAQQTGESVDYLVNSIVTGIGRKSPLILDNLGISASRLREEMNGVSLATASVGEVSEAVGRIIDNDLGNMGELADTASTKMQRLSASWENLQVAIGEAGNETGLFGAAIDAATKAMDLFSSKSTTTFQKFEALALAVATGGLSLVALGFEDAGKKADEAAAAQKRLELVQRSADAAMQTFGDNIGLFVEELRRRGGQEDFIAELTFRIAEADKKRAAEIENIANLTAKLNELEEVRVLQTGDQLAATNNDIKAINEKIKKLKELGTVTKEVSIAPVVQLIPVLDTVALQKSIDEEFGSGIVDGIKIPIKFDFSDTERQLLESINRITTSVDVGEIDLLGGESEKAQAEMDATIIKFQQVKASAVDTMLGIQDAVSGSVNALISGQQTAVQALANVTLDVIDLFLKQALAAAIANAVKFGGPLPVGLALAGVAVGVVRSLFSKNVGHGGGGGGGSGGTGATRGVREGSTERQSIRVELGTTEFKFNGRELEAALKSNQQKTSIIGG